MKKSDSQNKVLIGSSYSWPRLGLQELWQYRELFYFLSWRDIKVRYKQTLVGATWAILQPFLTMMVFSIFFGRITKILSEGIPYPIFSYAGLLLWVYFSESVSGCGNSLIGSTNLITKVYFPRLIIPISAAITGIIDYLIALSILVIMMFFYGVTPNASIIFLPVILFLSFFSAAGLGLWFSALNVKYRDIHYIIPFFIQLLLFATPVIYPTTIIPSPYRWVLYLNPISGIIDAHRACLLGHKPVDLVLLSASALISLLIFVSGLLYFHKTERFFADVI